jgi:hypothetical protein
MSMMVKNLIPPPSPLGADLPGHPDRVCPGPLLGFEHPPLVTGFADELGVLQGDGARGSLEKAVPAKKIEGLLGLGIFQRRDVTVLSPASFLAMGLEIAHEMFQSLHVLHGRPSFVVIYR